MITSNSREKEIQAKQETDNTKLSKAPSTSTRQWSAFRNPRIVRVSRSFGGKDRHSKVCTIRGLRDRRIRLSIPTAIQLYDLQDRLGLSQPSKVIDWLIDVAKDDIDKLPPLQFPQGFGTQLFDQYQQQMFSPLVQSYAAQSSLAPFPESQATATGFIKNSERFHNSLGIKINNVGLDLEEHNPISRSRFWEVESTLRLKNKEVENFIDKGKWMKTSNDAEENQDGICKFSLNNHHHHMINPASDSHQLPTGLLLNNPVPAAAFNTYCHPLDNSNLSLSQFGKQPHGISYISSSQPDQNSLNINAAAAVSLPMPSSLALSSGSQLFFCQPAATLPSLFPAYLPHYGNSSSTDSNSRDMINRLQLNSVEPTSSNLQQAGIIGSSNNKNTLAVNVNYPWIIHNSQNNVEESQNKTKDN